MIKDVYQDIFNLSDTESNLLMKNNKHEVLYSFITLVNDIIDNDNILDIFNRYSDIVKGSLIQTMLKPNGISSLLKFIKDKGYEIPQIIMNK